MHNWTVPEKVDFPKFPPDTWGGYIPQLSILYTEMRVKKFSHAGPGGGIFHKFWSWTQKWKLYIDIFHGVSCNIMHITAIWNVYFQ